jgi:hypothetical protein
MGRLVGHQGCRLCQTRPPGPADLWRVPGRSTLTAAIPPSCAARPCVFRHTSAATVTSAAVGKHSWGSRVADSNPAVPTGQSLIFEHRNRTVSDRWERNALPSAEETAVVRPVGDITPLVRGPPSPAKASSTRAHLPRVKGAAVGAHQPSRLVLGNTSQGPRRDKVAALADAVRQPRRPATPSARSFGRSWPALAGPGATVTRTARAELVPEPTDQKWPARPFQEFYLRRCHTPMPGKHTLHRDAAGARSTSRPTAARLSPQDPSQ